jgi:serine protease Do
VTHRTESHKAGVSIYQAHVIKIDTNADIALLLINAPAGAFLGAEFALETPARVGDPVFAVGNFFGNAFDNSVSQGIISQIGIDPGNGFPWPVADQTDCAAFPGSSGGPLFNTDGKVLGLVVGGRDSALVWFVPVRAIVEFAERNQVTWSVVGVFCPRDVNP